MNSARNEDAQANLARILGIVFVALVVTILAVGLLRSLVPNWVRSRTSPIRGIEMTLEQIDNAKLVMSLERHLSADTTPPREQLQSYLVRTSGGERHDQARSTGSTPLGSRLKPC